MRLAHFGSTALGAIVVALAALGASFEPGTRLSDQFMNSLRGGDSSQNGSGVYTQYRSTAHDD